MCASDTQHSRGLALPLRIAEGRDTLVLRELLPITQVADWRKQRRMWSELVAGSSAQATPT